MFQDQLAEKKHVRELERKRADTCIETTTTLNNIVLTLAAAALPQPPASNEPPLPPAQVSHLCHLLLVMD